MTGTIPVTSRRRNQSPMGYPGFNHPGLMPAGMAPAPAPAPAPVAPAAMPANRFGSSQAFQDSVNRQRALKSRRAGVFADLRSAGQNLRQAGQAAFADSQLASADLQTGNAFLNRDLAISNDSRENQVAGAVAGRMGSEAAVNTAKANVQIPAEAQESVAKARGLTEQAATEQQMRGPRVATAQTQADFAKRAMPLTLGGMYQDLAHKEAMLPYQTGAAAAGIDASRADTAMKQAGVPLLQGQVGQLRKRNQFLESTFARQIGQGTYEAPAAGGEGEGEAEEHADPATGKRYRLQGGQWVEVKGL